MKKLKLGKRDIFTPLKKTGKVPEIKSKHHKPPMPAQKEPDKKRQTYHLRVDLIPKIKEYAYFEKVAISDVVNDGMDKFLKGYKPKVNK